MNISGAKFEEHCFLEIFLIELYCYSGTTHDIITFLICITWKRKYLENEKRYSKKENTILLDFEKPFN